MKSNKAIGRAVGVLFIAGMVVGVIGNILIQGLLAGPDYLSTLTASSMSLAMGSMLLLMTVAGDTGHGVLMYPVLKRHNEGMAIGYLSFRIVNAGFLGVQVLLILAQIPLASEFLKAAGPDTLYFKSLGTLLIQANLYAYHLGMIFVGLAGLMMCYMFYRVKLVPRFLAIWGLVGYATILCGSVLEVMGFNLHMIQTIPGGLWELFIGVWLIVKGFNSSSTSDVPLENPGIQQVATSSSL